jgi:hypothetical protein
LHIEEHALGLAPQKVNSFIQNVFPKNKRKQEIQNGNKRKQGYLAHLKLYPGVRLVWNVGVTEQF